MSREEFLEPNLKLIFFIGTGKFTEDENGNPIEEFKNLTIFARASQDSNPRNYEMPGISVTDIVLKGKIVASYEGGWTPSFLPQEVDLESFADGDLSIAGKKVTGKFRFIPRPQPIFSTLQERFGESFRGYLKVSSRN